MAFGLLTATLIDPDAFPVFRCLRATYPMMEPNWLTKAIALVVIFTLLASAMKIYKEDISIDEEERGDREAANESSFLQPPGNAKEEISKMRLIAKQKIPVAIFSGFLFAFSLSISSMKNNSKVLDFLNLSLIPRGTWDPSLALVMGGGVIISAMSYQVIQGFNLVLTGDKVFSSPIMCPGKDFSIPLETTIDIPLVLGAILFGFGWGIGGLCPGPAVYQALIGQPQVMFIYVPSFAIGNKLATMTTF